MRVVAACRACVGEAGGPFRAGIPVVVQGIFCCRRAAGGTRGGRSNSRPLRGADGGCRVPERAAAAPAASGEAGASLFSGDPSSLGVGKRSADFCFFLARRPIPAAGRAARDPH